MCFLLVLARVSLIRLCALPESRESTFPKAANPVRLMRTFIDVLRDNALHRDRSVTFMRATGDERAVPYTELWLEARRRAHALLALGLRRGDRVALVLPEPEEFVLTFIAALTAGVVAVPIYPPQTLAKMEAYGDTVRHVLAASGAKVLITNDALRPLIVTSLKNRSVRKLCIKLSV